MKRVIEKRTKGQRAIFVVVFILFVIYALILLYPFVFAFNASLKQNGRAFMNNSISPAIPMYWSNYAKAFEKLEVNENPFWKMLMNTLWYAGATTFLSIMCTSGLSYVVSKYKFKGAKLIYAIEIFVMIIPIYGSLPTTYKLLCDLRIINSYAYVLTATSGLGSGFILMYAFYKSIPWSYAEAAMIDGASHFKTYIKIMFPMALPAISALIVLTFVGNWNDYNTPLLFMSNLPTLSSGLWLYEQQIKYTANQPIYFAGVMISLIPIVIIYILASNTIMENVYTGGLKG